MVSEAQEMIDLHRNEFDRGYVQVYTGDGKGKSTAAFGLALRAAGAGLRVFIAQFIKSGRYSEIDALEKLADRITCRQYGRGCWLKGEPAEEDRRLARAGLAEAADHAASGEYQLVVLDEANVAQWFGLFDVEDLLALIDRRHPRTELVFTGRKAHQRLIDRADLVTEMTEVKHYYRHGVLARRGIES